LLELPDRAAEKFWNEEPFAKNGGYQRDARITVGCLGVEESSRAACIDSTADE